MAERKRRHRWVQRKGLDGKPVLDTFDCRCGASKRPSLFKDVLFRYPDGGGVSLWRLDPLPRCVPPSTQKDKP
jgi:hypothetical protein